LKQVLAFAEIERLHHVGTKYVAQLQELQGQVEGLKLQLGRSGSFETERTHYEELTIKLKTDIMEMEGRIQSLLAENARLTDLSNKRLKDATNMRASTNNFVESPVVVMASQADYTEMRLNFDKEKHNLELQLSRLQATLDMKDRELAQIYEVSTQRKRENDTLLKQFEDIRMRGSAGTNAKAENEVRSLRDQLTSCTFEIEETQRSRDMYKQELDKAIKKYNELMMQSGKESYRQSGNYSETLSSPGYITTVSPAYVSNTSPTFMSNLSPEYGSYVSGGFTSPSPAYITTTSPSYVTSPNNTFPQQGFVSTTGTANIYETYQPK